MWKGENIRDDTIFSAVWPGKSTLHTIFQETTMRQTLMKLLLCFLLLMPLFTLADLHSYALVNDDGTIQVRGRTVHFYGIYIPETNYNCQTFIRPVQCGQRAALALKFKIQGFVRCEEKSRNEDRSINAICRVGVSSFSEGKTWPLIYYVMAGPWPCRMRLLNTMSWSA